MQMQRIAGSALRAGLARAHARAAVQPLSVGRCGSRVSAAPLYALRVAQRRMASAAAADGAAGGADLTPEEAELLATPREIGMEYDVLVIGGGPAGLSAAIKLRQLAIENDKELTVCVVEKGYEVGAHIISGNVFEPHALNELIPDWKEKGAPLETPAGKDQMLYLTETGKMPLPVIPHMHNTGNYVISLGQLCRWLGEQAESLEVDIFAGYPAAEVVLDDSGAVVGVATADVGVGKDGRPKPTFERGMELRGKQTLFAEGCRGSCSEWLMEHFNLREGKDPQQYGLGVKEVWRIPAEKAKPGLIQHTIGWPLPADTYGGSFLYHLTHQGEHYVQCGFVIGLGYKNPYLNPYQEFQRWKHHPAVAEHLEGGECIQYGARCLNEGGFQSIPKLTFPGGALIGCSAGFLNMPKIKGTHTAMKSGMLAAEEVFKSLSEEYEQSGKEVTGYQTALEGSWVWSELKSVRNYQPALAKFGLYAGSLYCGVTAYVLRGNEPWTFKHDHLDSEATAKAGDAAAKPIEYPKPDGVLSFDLLSNLQRSGTNHEDDQPPHLRIKPELAHLPAGESFTKYAAPETRFCPARVYEYPEGAEGGLVINAQNCVHCKCCSIKMPGEYITWTVPESGGGGPAYEMM